jgi:hypothetical protein
MLDECQSIYRFIVACSSTSTSASNLFICSQTLLQRLELPLHSPGTGGQKSIATRLTVPSQSFERYENEFKMMMDSATDLRDDIDKLKPDQEGPSRRPGHLSPCEKHPKCFEH